MKSKSETDKDKEEKAAKWQARKDYWSDFFADQFDFSDPIDLDQELGLEFGTSSYVGG